MTARVDFRRRVAGRVRKLRDDRGWSQEELGAKWRGRSRYSVTRLENGKDAGPAPNLDLNLLSELAAAFDMSLSEFIWPIVEPEATVQAVREERARFVRQVRERFDQMREEYLAGLNSADAELVLSSVGQLSANASREQLGMVVAMLDATAQVVAYGVWTGGQHSKHSPRSSLDQLLWGAAEDRSDE